MMHRTLTVSALALLVAACSAAPAEDAVPTLPLFGTPPAPQYSGFLNADKGYKGVRLHYWFAEAEVEDAKSAPIVLWLNGGPGSSSILGMLQEHGPLLVNNSGMLIPNPYAWTKKANLLILESPAGVGYSYCGAGSGNGPKTNNCSNTDKSTAAAARAAMQDFFSTKFPELAKNEFFITGESYAGVYVPTLTREILDNAPEINIKGVAVGDPCTDNVAQQDSMDMLWYGHKYGFVPDKEYELLWTTCRARFPHPITRGKWGAAETAQLQGGEQQLPRSTMSSRSPQCVLAQRKFLASSSRGFSQGWPLAWINDLTLYGPAAVVPFTQPGSLNYKCAQYMMRADVKAALHLEASPSSAWPGPPSGWSYTSDWAACNGDAPPGTDSMVAFYRYIAPKLRTTFVYNGDTDPCVSYEGTRTAIESVGFDTLPGASYRPWFFNASRASLQFLTTKPLLFGPDLATQDAGAQFAGEVVNYAHNLSFLTVHGSGHMVPQFRPQAALRMLQAMLTGLPLSPPMETDAKISAMSDGAYDDYLDMWTTQAKQAA